MEDLILKLFPIPVEERPLEGLFLGHDLRQRAKEAGKPYIYSNFITSLDGRIATAHPTRPGLIVPKETANERDWRLFQELAAHADIIISSGRYLRDWAEGRSQEILQVDDPRFADLRGWRKQQGLHPQPDIALISGSLRFPIPDVLTAGGRQVVVFTTTSSDPERVRMIRDMGCRVIFAGEESVDGNLLTGHFAQLGYRTIYSSAGPRIQHLLLKAGMVDRLYLSYANRLLAGEEFATIVEGPQFKPAIDMTLTKLYYDASGLDGVGQLFTVYDKV